MCTFLTGCGEGKSEAGGEIVDLPVESSTYQELDRSEAGVFDKSDAVVDGVTAGMSLDKVKSVLGEPMADKESEDKTELFLFYDQMTITMIKLDGEYALSGVRITGSNHSVGRGLKVGQNKDEIFALFYRHEDCLNNNYMSPDGETVLGKMLYGACTLDNLEAYKSGNVEYGVIMYNGAEDMESAEKLTYEYVYMEAPFMEEKPSTNDDFYQLDVEVDKEGRIIEIAWYYFEELK